MANQNRGGRPQLGFRISSVILQRLQDEADRMDVSLTAYVKSVLWDHIRELDKPKPVPVQPPAFRAWGN